MGISYQIKKYPHSDHTYYRKADGIKSKIVKIEKALLAGIFCDKWGEPLEVGDSVEYSTKRNKQIKTGTIEVIRGQMVIIEGGHIHWSYLVKCS